MDRWKRSGCNVNAWDKRNDESAKGTRSMATIYGIRKIGNEHPFYIGCTIHDINARFKQHIYSVSALQHPNKHFQNKVKKIGIDNVEVYVIESVKSGKQFDREEYWIAKYLGDGVKLTNIIHNTINPKMYMVGRKYSLARNWEWLLLWYDNYKLYGSWIAHKPELQEKIDDAQLYLANVIEQLRHLSDEERELAFEHFE